MERHINNAAQQYSGEKHRYIRSAIFQFYFVLNLFFFNIFFHYYFLFVFFLFNSLESFGEADEPRSRARSSLGHPSSRSASSSDNATRNTREDTRVRAARGTSGEERMTESLGICYSGTPLYGVQA